jgi:hypothetical protein
VVTGKADSRDQVLISSDVTNGDGTHTVTVGGALGEIAAAYDAK